MLARGEESRRAVRAVGGNSREVAIEGRAVFGKALVVDEAALVDETGQHIGPIAVREHLGIGSQNRARNSSDQESERDKEQRI